MTVTMAMAIAKTVTTMATERGPGLWDRMTLLLCYSLLCYNKGDTNNDSSHYHQHSVARTEAGTAASIWWGCGSGTQDEHKFTICALDMTQNISIEKKTHNTNLKQKQ